MTNTDETYNGWTNRETWAFMLHINNDQGLQESAMDTARYTMTERYDPAYVVSDNAIGRSVTERFRSMIDEHDIVEAGIAQVPSGLLMFDREVGSWWRIDHTEVGAAMREAVGELDDESDVADCPVCGEPIDYCQGHGEIGDPAGAAILAAEDQS